MLAPKQIESLGINKPIMVEISGVYLDAQTIFLSKDYKKEIDNYKKIFLEDWEKRHNEFLNNLIDNQDNVIKNYIKRNMKKMKLDITDIKINARDNVTSSIPKIISLEIASINSFHSSKNWQPSQNKSDDNVLHRVVKVNCLKLCIYNDSNKTYSNLSHVDFINPVSFRFKLTIIENEVYR